MYRFEDESSFSCTRGYDLLVIDFPDVTPGEALAVSATLYTTYLRCPDQALGRLRGEYPAESRASFRGGLAHRVFARHLVEGPIDGASLQQVCREEIGKSLNPKIAALGMKPSELVGLISEVGELYGRFKRLSTEGFNSAEVYLEVEPTDGLVLRGSVDAVFDDPEVGTRLVDWKTGAVSGAADQLAFYTLLWAMDRGQLPGAVEAVSVGTGERFTGKPTESEAAATAAAVAGMVSVLRDTFAAGGHAIKIGGAWCRYCPLLEACDEGTAAAVVFRPGACGAARYFPAMPAAVAIHAHPDDESSKGAGTMSLLASAGYRCVLVCATGGEAGDILNPTIDEAALAGTLGELRSTELDAAAAIIGYSEVVRLGHRDSGMAGDAANAHPEAFVNVATDTALEQVVRVVRRERPEVVFGYDEHERYPHPDHLKVHEITTLLRAAAGDPSRYPKAGPPWEIPLIAAPSFTARRARTLLGAIEASGLSSPLTDRLAEIASQDDDRSRLLGVNVAGFVEQARAALRAHATQVDPEGPWFQIPVHVVEEAYPFEDFEVLVGSDEAVGAVGIFEAWDSGAGGRAESAAPPRRP